MLSLVCDGKGRYGHSLRCTGTVRWRTKLQYTRVFLFITSYSRCIPCVSRQQAIKFALCQWMMVCINVINWVLKLINYYHFITGRSGRFKRLNWTCCTCSMKMLRFRTRVPIQKLSTQSPLQALGVCNRNFRTRCIRPPHYKSGNTVWGPKYGYMSTA